jgi:poly-gamma-glutamate capsule biosynthesis protein CapA/YwtB (metallophosphatase superfamily)
MVDSGTSTKCAPTSTRCFAFRVPTRYGKYLKEAGFDVMSLANNHAGDFGDAGRTSTRKVLDDLGIKHAGSDKTQFASTILNVKGKRVAFIAFAHNNISLNVNDLDAARRAVSDLTKRADIIVVSFHGGAEGTGNVRVPQQTEMFFGEKRGNLPLFARTVIDAGADLVLGHGPHVLRGMEIYKDRLVAYSLGNFATYGWFQLAGATAETMVLEVKVDSDGKFAGGKINPFRLEGRGILTPDSTKSAISTVRSLSQMDFPTTAPKINDDGTISAK